ncbi:MAG: polysaccharide export protein [Hyphomicrobiales bacterium]|nr:polysaccharide export protein [Hyphomicrobiales bacterium]
MKHPHKPYVGAIGRIAAALVLCLGASACVSGSDSYNAGQSRTTNSMQAAAVPGAKAGNLRVVKVLPTPVQGGEGASQQIAKNDVLEIDVFQVDELDRTVQVNSNGLISLPLIGEIQAAGHSARDLEKNIATAYGQKYLQSPQVTVFVKESIGQRVVVDGEVNKAGIYPVTAGSSLLGVVSQAGGLKSIADPSKIYVYRDYGDQKLVANYSVNDIRLAKKSDPTIYGGDVVVVFSSSSRVAMQNLTQILGIATKAAVFVP